MKKVKNMSQTMLDIKYGKEKDWICDVSDSVFSTNKKSDLNEC